MEIKDNEVHIVLFDLDGIPVVRVFTEPDVAQNFNNAIVNTVGKSSIFTETIDRGVQEIKDDVPSIWNTPVVRLKDYNKESKIESDDCCDENIWMDKPIFLGIGSFDNTKLGNTSCYIRRGNSLFLVDCGYDVFEKIKKVIDDSESSEKPIDNIRIMITHLHGDHCGSLSTLIEYCYYVKNMKKIDIIYPEPDKIRNMLKSHLVKENMYYIHTETTNNSFYIGDISVHSIQYFKLVHSIYDEDVFSYAYQISIENKTFIFAWDCCDIHPDIYERFMILAEAYKSRGDVETVYLFHDTCFAEYPGNKHTNYTKLLNIFKDYRHLIYPVHLDNEDKLNNIMLNNGFGDINCFYK